MEGLIVLKKVGEADGFHNIRRELKYFELDLTAQNESEADITGEYLPQETSEEGQLIPEMHDPLLNDPEVLL